MPDPALTRQELVESGNRDAQALRALFAGWEEMDLDGTGLTVSEVFRALEDNAAEHRNPRFSVPLRWPTLRAAIETISNAPPGKLPGAQSFGMKLHHLKGRVVDHKFFASTEKQGTKLWRVEKAAECASPSDPEPSGREKGTNGTKGTIPLLRVRNSENQYLYGAVAISPTSPPSPTDNTERRPEEPEFT